MRLRLYERRHLASDLKDQGRAITDAIVIGLVLLLFFLLIRGIDVHSLLEDAGTPLRRT